MNISIEPMRTSDIADVLRVDHLSFNVPWRTESYVTELSNRSAQYLVARLDGRVVGYGGIWVIDGDAHITTLAVTPNKRGMHLGERLLHALICEANYRRSDHITLEVRRLNKVAKCLYDKYGFHTVDVRSGYYNDNGDDALVMRIDDPGSDEYQDRLQQLRLELEANQHSS